MELSNDYNINPDELFYLRSENIMLRKQVDFLTEQYNYALSLIDKILSSK